MASPFQQYQSGIEASTGNLVPAYSAMAQRTASAISGFGEDIAKGIEKYSQNKQEDEMLTAKNEAIAGSLLALKQALGDSKENEPISNMLNDLLGSSGKVAGSSLTQKRALLGKLELGYNNLIPTINQFRALSDENLKRMTTEGLANAPETEKIVEDLSYKAGANSINSSAPISVQRGKYAENLTKDAVWDDKQKVWISGTGDKIDLSLALKNWDAGAKETLRKAESTGNTAATVMLEQLNALAEKRKGEEYRAGLAEGVTTNEELYNAGRMQGLNINPAYAPQKVKGSSTTPELQYKLAEQSAELKNKANEVKPVLMDKLNSAIEQIKKEVAAGMTPVEFERNLGRFERGIIGDLDKTAPSGYTIFGKTIEEQRQDWYKNTPEGQAINEILPLWKDAVQQVRAGIGSSGSGDLTGFTSGLFSKNKTIGDIATTRLGLPSELRNQRPVSEITNPDERISAISGLEKIQSTLNVKKESLPTTEKVTPESVLANQGLNINPAEAKASLSLALPKITVGTREKEIALSEEKTKEFVRNWVTENMGITKTITNPDGTTRTIKVTPANYDSIYKVLRPNPKVVSISGYDFLETEKGYEKLGETKSGGLDRAERAKQMKGTFGKEPIFEGDESRVYAPEGLIPEPLYIGTKDGAKYSGLSLVGTYTGGGDAEKWKNEFSSMLQAEFAVERLIEISNNPAEVTSFDLSNEAQALAFQVKAGAKERLVGSQVTGDEWKMLADYIVDPTRIANMETAERRKLNVVLGKVKADIENAKTGSGVTVIDNRNNRGSAGDIIGQKRVDRLTGVSR